MPVEKKKREAIPDAFSETCVLCFGPGWDGRGWYYYDEEYPSEGTVGSFQTWGEAADHAETGGYVRPTPDHESLRREAGEVFPGDPEVQHHD